MRSLTAGTSVSSSAIHHKLQPPHLHQRSSRTTPAHTLSNSTDKEDIDVAHITSKFHLSVVHRQISAEDPVAPAQRRAREVWRYVCEGFSERTYVYVGAGAVLVALTYSRPPKRAHLEITA